MKVDVKYTKLFINNEWVDSVSGNSFATINPATEQEICQVAAASKEDVDIAVAAARKAFHRSSPWRKMNAADRGKLMLKLCDLIEQHADELAKIESLDQGKPCIIARHMDVEGAIGKFRYMAGMADKIHGITSNSNVGLHSYTQKVPIGVCALIVPWNFPLLMAAYKLAPALAAGCTMVLKPAENTPLSALYLAQLIKEAGFPAGVVNVINGLGHIAGDALSHHMDVDKIAFTGSTVVGHKIQKASGDSNLKNVSLELGGKSPMIVMPDCDLDAAVETACGQFFNAGAVCIAPSRTFVHEKIHDEFVAKCKVIAEKRIVGEGFDPSTEMGPQVSKIEFDKILRLIDSGKNAGANLITGGSKCERDCGYFIKPTIFTQVKGDMEIAKKEIFGPVMSVTKWSDFDSMIDDANDTHYGLAAGVFTKDWDTANKVSTLLEAGTVWVNTWMQLPIGMPFGGWKQSGIGYENCMATIDMYCKNKSVTTPVNI